MTDCLQEQRSPESAKKAQTFIFVAWRNLWRNRRRTLLTIGGMGFAIFIVQLAMSFQAGSYGPMIDLASKYAGGHIQVQHPEYLNDPRIEYSVHDANALLAQIEKIPGITAATVRTEGFALISNDERSMGAMVIGVDPEREMGVSNLPKDLIKGNFLANDQQAYIGSAMSRNLQLSVGDEVVILGTDAIGGVAVMVLTVGGIFESGLKQLDRSVVLVPINRFQEAFGLDDASHRIVALTDDPLKSDMVVKTIRSLVPENLAVRNWMELMPDVHQAIEFDRVTNVVFYWILVGVVLLSLSNTFLMVVYERIRELGMLMAIGMRWAIAVRMLMAEAMMLWILGCALGFCVGYIAIFPMSQIGIAVPGMEEFASQMHIPDRIYPTYDIATTFFAPLAFGAGTAITALIPTLRLRKLNVIDALRHDE